LWHPQLRPHFTAVQLTLLVGFYAIRHYLPQAGRGTMAEALYRWREFLPGYFILPHPSWRTTYWQRSNPWFEAELLPELRRRVGRTLTDTAGGVNEVGWSGHEVRIGSGEPGPDRPL
jgi:uracil-DNA glycosylase